MHEDKTGIGTCLIKLHSALPYRRPWGMLAHVFGIAILLSFTLVIGPMFALMWVCSQVYFRLYRQKPVSAGPYFNFDRHRIRHLSFWDRVGCEYCEFANGTLQWGLAVANEVERKWCPIRNACDPHCAKAKEWRKDFLPYQHASEDLADYYREQFPAGGPK